MQNDNNDDDDLAYLIVAKEACLPCDRPSKWCASCCCSHTCTNMSNTSTKMSSNPCEKNIIRYPKYHQKTLPQIFSYVDIDNIESTHKKEMTVGGLLVWLLLTKELKSFPRLPYPPISQYLPSSPSLHSSISPRIAQNRKNMESTFGQPGSLDQYSAEHSALL